MKIYPFAEPSILSQDYIKKIGFEFTDFNCKKLKNGLINIYVEWTMKDKSISLKRAVRGSEMFASNYVSMELSFPDTTHEYGDQKWEKKDLSFEVGLYTDDEIKWIDYEPLFFQNYGYAASCWFGKKNEWDSIDGAETLLPYPVDKN